VSHKYDDAVISALYQDTNIAIKVGDRVLMHGKRKGTVDDWGLTVEPFGFYGTVEKLDDSAQ
jgi:hypothetical protein